MRILAIAVIAVLSAAAVAEPRVAEHLQAVSVTIRAGATQGSGTIVTRTLTDANGPVQHNFVWTAAHVIDGLRSVETVIEPSKGTERKIIRFRDAQVVQEFRQGGRRVGESCLDARVVKFSKKDDLCLLQVRKTGYTMASMKFYLDAEIPPLGTDLYHVGSMAGQELGANSMTQGIVAQIGQVLDGQSYDQTTVTACPGSSGGGVFLRDGRLIGVLTLGVRGGDNFNFRRTRPPGPPVGR